MSRDQWYILSPLISLNVEMENLQYFTVQWDNG